MDDTQLQVWAVALADKGIVMTWDTDVHTVSPDGSESWGWIYFNGNPAVERRSVRSIIDLWMEVERWFLVQRLDLLIIRQELGS